MGIKSAGKARSRSPFAGTRGVLYLVAAYAAIASIWILGADWFLALTSGSVQHFTVWDVTNDLLFVVSTTALLYVVLIGRAKTKALHKKTFSLISDQARDGIILCNLTLNIVYTNQAAQKISGYSEEEMVGHPIDQFFVYASGASLGENTETLNDQPFIHRECMSLHKDGRHLHLEVTAQRLPDGTYLVITSDRTEAHTAMKIADEERQRLKALVGAIPDPVWLKDAAGSYISFNPALEKLLDLPADQILNHTDEELLPSGELEAFLHADQEARGSATPVTFSQMHRHPDGVQSHFEITKNPVFDTAGELIGIVGIARDVTAAYQRRQYLAASDEFNRAVLDSTATQTAVVDKSGTVIGTNEGWAQFTRDNSDTPPDERKTGIGSNFFAVCSHIVGDDRTQAEAAMNGVRAVLDGATSHFSMECPCVTPNGEMWFVMNVTPLRLGAGGAVITYVDISSIKQAQKMQARFALQLQALARMHQDIQEKERHHLSMELHDQIGQSLAALKILLVSAKLNQDDHQSSNATLNVAQEITDEIANTTRDIARRLRPPLLDELGLKPALAWYIKNLTLPPALDLRFEENIDAERFSEAVELACFRIVQEAITNALRHADATRITVGIVCMPHQIAISIHDNGKGFDTDTSLNENDEPITLGLIGMRERVASLGGKYEIDSQPNQGTRVSACLPRTTRL